MDVNDLITASLQSQAEEMRLSQEQKINMLLNILTFFLSEKRR